MAVNYEAVRREVTADFLRYFTNNCVMPRLLKRNFESYFQGARQIGDSLDIRTALRTIGADGQAFQPEGSVRVTVPLSIAYWNQESWLYNDTEKAMFLDKDQRKAYLEPRAINLANKVDRYMMNYMSSIIPNFVGTPGSVPTTLPTYGNVRAKLNQLLALEANRYVVWNSSFETPVVTAGSTVFNPQDVIGKQYLTGKVGRFANLDFYRDEQIPSFTTGTYAGSGVVNGGNQVGSSILTNGWTPASLSLSQGNTGSDKVTFAGCYEINYQSRQVVPGVLKQFSVIAPVTDAAGAATLQIFPAIIPSGPYQNCSASPTAGGAVTIAGASGTLAQTAIAFQEEAFTWVPIKLMDVSEYGAKSVVMHDPETGLSMRCVEQWDNVLGQVTMRMDYVWGIASTEADRKSLVIFG